MRRTLLSLLCLPLLAAPGLASGPGETHTSGSEFIGSARLTYEVFETSIQHVDLESCPVQFDPEAVFCRMTLANDQAHVFVFGFEDDQPLLAIKSYDLDDDFLPF